MAVPDQQPPSLLVGNLLAQLPHDLAIESCEILAQSANLRIERIVSLGHSSPPDFWYDQPLHEFVVLLSGAACVLFEGQPAPHDLRPGDYLLIPAHCRHRVTWTSPDEASVWLAIHYDSPSASA